MDIIAPKGDDHLLTQPASYSPEWLAAEVKRMQYFIEHFNYADEAAGVKSTFDPVGRYNCGSCNQVDGSGCLLLNPADIDPMAGSCEDWETGDEGVARIAFHAKSPTGAFYSVAKNGFGFSCIRCPFAERAVEVGDEGRGLYCKRGDFRVTPKACCSLNGA